MAAVHHYRKLNRSHPAEIAEGVESSADGPACVKHVIDKNDIFVVDVRRHFSGTDDRLKCNASQIVTIEIDVEGSDCGVAAHFLTDRCRHPLRHRDTAPMNADEDQFSP